jgi:hypothetical protein
MEATGEEGSDMDVLQKRGITILVCERIPVGTLPDALWIMLA